MYDDPDGTLWGAGAGVAARAYQIKNEYRGIFIEGQFSALIHHNRFSGNSSNLNFQSGFGLGYHRCVFTFGDIEQFCHGGCASDTAFDLALAWVVATTDSDHRLLRGR